MGRVFDAYLKGMESRARQSELDRVDQIQRARDAYSGLPPPEEKRGWLSRRATPTPMSREEAEQTLGSLDPGYLLQQEQLSDVRTKREEAGADRNRDIGREFAESGLQAIDTLRQIPLEQRQALFDSRIRPALEQQFPELSDKFDSLTMTDEDLDAGRAQMTTILGKDPAKVEPTTKMREAEAAGLVKGTPEYAQFIGPRAAVNVNVGDQLGKAPAGYAYRRDSSSGQPIITEGGVPELVKVPGGPAEMPSEGERRVAYAAENLQNLEADLEDVLSTYEEFDPSSGWNIMGDKSNFLASPAYQQFAAVADEWTTNIVFLRSGATAREDEKLSSRKNFFPQPGDDPATMERKKMLRKKQTERALAHADRGIKRAPKSEDQRKSFVSPSGKSASWDEIVRTAELHGKTPEEVISDLGLKARD